MLYNQPQLACHECDALCLRVPLHHGQKLACPRCGAMLQKAGRDSTAKGIALSLTALILMPPAYLLPIMTFNMLGSNTVDTVAKGVAQMFTEGFWLVALLVLLCSMVAPVVEALLVLSISVMTRLRHYNSLLIFLLKAQRKIKKWGMLEVYLLGVLVAYVKLIDDGQVYFGVGLFCFCSVLLATTLNAVMFDVMPIWERIGQHRQHQLARQQVEQQHENG